MPSPSIQSETKGQHDFGGLTFDPTNDGHRLSTQLSRVYEVMRDGNWRTFAEIKEATGQGSEAGISARLRDLRKDKFQEQYGPLIVERQRRGAAAAGLWEYRVVPGEPDAEPKKRPKPTNQTQPTKSETKDAPTEQMSLFDNAPRGALHSFRTAERGRKTR